MATVIKEISSNKCFGGLQKVFSHVRYEPDPFQEIIVKSSLISAESLPSVLLESEYKNVQLFKGDCWDCVIFNSEQNVGCTKLTLFLAGLQFRLIRSVLKCEMKFAVYLPPKAIDGTKSPVLYWLSGLTCTEQNFIFKSGGQRLASHHNVILVCPDTSPRGCNIPGEDDSDDFGTGAGFYVDATVDPWKTNYNMYSYVTKELPEVVRVNFPVEVEQQSIMGHSMGGHGALICYLKNPGKYCSVSAFAPICNPSRTPWGKKALSGYLGEAETESWKEYDASCLVSKFEGIPREILIDQGDADVFLHRGELEPMTFVHACKEAQVPVVLQKREGYDHSYYFIASFLEDHFSHHMRFLKG